MSEKTTGPVPAAGFTRGAFGARNFTADRAPAGFTGSQREVNR